MLLRAYSPCHLVMIQFRTLGNEITRKCDQLIVHNKFIHFCFYFLLQFIMSNEYMVIHSQSLFYCLGLIYLIVIILILSLSNIFLEIFTMYTYYLVVMVKFFSKYDAVMNKTYCKSRVGMYGNLYAFQACKIFDQKIIE